MSWDDEDNMSWDDTRDLSASYEQLEKNKEHREKRDRLLEEVNFNDKAIFYVYCLLITDHNDQEYYYVGKTRDIKKRIKAHIKNSLDSTSTDYFIHEIIGINAHSCFTDNEDKRKEYEKHKERQFYLEMCENYPPERVLGGK